MSWGIINGDERLIPQGMNHELKIEAGKTYKFRLLLKPGEEPWSFFEHTADNEKVENGQSVKVFRTAICPKGKDNPYAPCKLCDGQQIRRRMRNASNIWSYETNEVKVLKGGEDIWKPMGTLVKMGIDITTLDFAVTRTGTGKNDTSYSVVNLGPATTPLPDDVMSKVYDIREEYAPSTEAEMKAMVEAVGFDWNKMIVPPAIQYPESLQEVLEHVIPNTKYKGQTMKQVWDTNRGMIEFFAKSNRISPEKAGAQVLLVNLGGAQIPGVPIYNQQGGTPTPTKVQANTPAQTPTDGQAKSDTPAQTPPPVDTGKQAKIKEINTLLQSNQKFIKGGYQMIMDTMKEASGGKTSINEFTDPELDKMLELCKAE